MSTLRAKLRDMQRTPPGNRQAFVDVIKLLRFTDEPSRGDLELFRRWVRSIVASTDRT
jgi:hypothetical protein